MYKLTQDHLYQLLPGNDFISEWHEALMNVLPDYNINTRLRIAAFIAQCAHESMNFKVLKENLNYSAKSLLRVFSKYFDSEEAERYQRKPDKIANRVYANRMENGPEESGDGWRYRGRGILQITGKRNYRRISEYVNIPLEEMPSYLETFEGAVVAACWYWNINNLNRFCDSQDMVGLTRAINGGLNGYDDRVKHYEHALNVLEDDNEQEPT